jgi:hypothetical protein
VLRFVDRQFDHSTTPAEIRRLFPAAQNIACEPMPLKDIFVSLAMSSRHSNAA